MLVVESVCARRCVRTLQFLVLTAVAALTLPACDAHQGAGPVSDEKPVFAIDVQYDQQNFLLTETAASNKFDTVNPALISEKDNVGRLTGVNVHWTSSDPNVVTVLTPDALSILPDCICSERPWGTPVRLQPKALGTATITGTVTGAPTVSGKTVTAHFTVTINPTPTKITATPNPIIVQLGTSGTADAVLIGVGSGVVGKAENAGVSWKCLDPAIATAKQRNSNIIDCEPEYPVEGPAIQINPHAVGTARFEATYYSTKTGGPGGTLLKLVDTLRVTVTPAPTVIARVVVTPGASSLIVGGYRNLTAAAFDAAGNAVTGLPITWGSRNTSVLSVSNVNGLGQVIALASGNAPGQTQAANIFATIGGVTGDAAITVYRAPARVIITPNPDTLSINQSVTLRARFIDNDNITPIPFIVGVGIDWRSDNAAVAQVTPLNDSTATLTAVAPGLTTIRLRTGYDALGIADVVVRTPPAATTIDLFVGTGTTQRRVSATGETVALLSTLQLQAVVTDQSGALFTDVVSWSSASPTIASVDAVSGLVTAKSAGTAVITAKSSSNPSLTKSVTIVVPAAPTGGVAASMRLTPATASIRVGQQQQYTATLLDASGNAAPMPTGGTIGFAVDNSNIAATLNTTGLVSALGVGNTTVRAFLKINGVDANIFAAAALTVVP